MSEKRMLIVDAEVLAKIDANRGEMSPSEFLDFIIDTQLGVSEKKSVSHNRQQYVQREEFEEFSLGMKDLLRRFLDFFISYGMELGDEPKDNTFSELVQKLQALSSHGGKSKTSR